MKNPNQPKHRSQLAPAEKVLAAGILGLTVLGGITAGLELTNPGHAPESDGSSQNKQTDTRRIIGDAANPSVKIELDGEAGDKAANRAFVLVDVNGHEIKTQIETPPLDALGTNPLIVNASIAAAKPGGPGDPQQPEFLQETFASNNGNTTTVVMDEILPDGDVQRLDADSMNVPFGDFAPGQWTQTPDHEWHYTLDQLKGGPDMPHISVSEGSGK